MHKYKHCYIIPTNRAVAHSLQSYIQEIREAISLGLINKDDIIVTVLHDGDEELCKENLETMHRLLETEDISWLYVSREMKNQFVKHFCGDDSELQEIFKKVETNYGYIATISSLIAYVLGAEYLHRRDSDTALYTSSCGTTVSPLHTELKVLQEKSDCSVVGSNYFCNNDVDVRLFEDAPHLERQLYYMLGNTEESLSEKMALSAEPELVEPQWADIPEEGMWPDMGNIAFGPLYKEVPFPPHGTTLGTDYFLTAVASFRGDRLVLHNQRVLHEYRENRSTLPYWEKYYCSLAKYVDYNEFYFPLFESLSGASSSREAMIQSLKENNVEESRVERTKVLLRFSGIFSELEDEKGFAISEAIKNEIDSILNHTEKGAERHLTLLEKWKDIKERAVTFDHFQIRNQA